MKTQRIKKENGITLVALVVTIIILLILAGVVIGAISGDNGILKKAKEAVNIWKEAEEKEREDLAKLENEIKGGEKEPQYLDIEVPIITVEEKELWTNTSKKITISTKDGYAIKYTLDGSSPSKINGIEYTNEITVTNNCQIRAVYIRDDGLTSRESKEEISKIDKLVPNAPEIESTTPNKHSIIINIKEGTQDKESTIEDGRSGVEEYKYYCTDGERTWESDWTTELSYKFSEIYGALDGVECECYVYSRDRALNESESSERKQSKTVLPSHACYLSGKKTICHLTCPENNYDIFTDEKANALIYFNWYNSTHIQFNVISYISEGCKIYLGNYGVGYNVQEINYHGITYYCNRIGTGANTSLSNIKYGKFGTTVEALLDEYYQE